MARDASVDDDALTSRMTGALSLFGLGDAVAIETAEPGYVELAAGGCGSSPALGDAALLLEAAAALAAIGSAPYDARLETLDLSIRRFGAPQAARRIVRGEGVRVIDGVAVATADLYACSEDGAETLAASASAAFRAHHAA